MSRLSRAPPAGASKPAPSTIEQLMDNSKRDKLQLFVMTWNMGNAEAEGLTHVFSEKNAQNKYDLFVIGLQESTYSLKNSKDCIEHLANIIDHSLGPKFYKVHHCYRAQLQLYVFARKTIKPRITSVEESIENTGFLHLFPNKGGILVTLQIDGTKLAFVSCHLAAHEGVKYCEERNASIVEILGGVRSGDKRFDITEQFHHVFWMGDMNYRTTYDTINIPANTKKNVKEFEAKEAQMEKMLSSSDITLGVDMRQMSFFSSKHQQSIVAVQGDSDSDSDAEDEPVASCTDDIEPLSPNSGAIRTDSGKLSTGEKPGSAVKKGGKEKKKERQEQMRKTLDLVVQEKWTELLSLDELNREIAAGRVLNGFTALQPHFPPTFKRARHLSIDQLSTRLSNAKYKTLDKLWNVQYDDENTDEAKMVSKFYNNKRMPSFTDRILYKSMPTFEGCVTSMFFESCELASSSDHKPVSAGFEVLLSKGEHGIYVDRQLLKWQGKVSKETSGNRSDVHIMKMTVSNLKGENLEEMDSAMFGGGSDPYIIITADPAHVLLSKGTFIDRFEGVKSKVIKHNLNPVWKDDMHLQLASIDLKGLARNASLIFSVWDEDLMNKDDLIGVFTIPLREIIRAFSEGRSYDFNEDLRSNSELMGKLSGSITIEGSYQDMLGGYDQLEHDRLISTERYLTLDEALQEHMHLNGCCCTIS